MKTRAGGKPASHRSTEITAFASSSFARRSKSPTGSGRGGRESRLCGQRPQGGSLEVTVRSLHASTDHFPDVRALLRLACTIRRGPLGDALRSAFLLG